MGEMVDRIIDGGLCQARLEATGVDITQGIPEVLREGPVSREEIEEVVGQATKGRM